MKKINAGDLIYVPSEVILYKQEEHDGRNDIISEWKKTSQPANLLVIHVNSTTYEVLYNDEHWLVKQQEVYKT